MRRCSEFNETQLAFLESQWKEGMVSVTRECYKMIEETAECIGISPARVKVSNNSHTRPPKELSKESTVSFSA